MAMKAMDDFLCLPHIAIVSVRRKGPQEPGNAICRKLKSSGIRVSPVNPALNEFDGETCYPSLAAIPTPPDGVIITVHRNRCKTIVEEALSLGIRHIWMHRSVGEGSVSDDAVAICRARGVNPIVGGCPMMVLAPVDFPHKCLRWVLGLTGKLPR